MAYLLTSVILQWNVKWTSQKIKSVKLCVNGKLHSAFQKEPCVPFLQHGELREICFTYGIIETMNWQASEDSNSKGIEVEVYFDLVYLLFAMYVICTCDLYAY